MQHCKVQSGMILLIVLIILQILMLLGLFLLDSGSIEMRLSHQILMKIIEEKQG